jgi:hypothetical protein
MLLDRDSVDTFIPRYLKKNGIENPPDVKWSTPIVGTIQKLSNNNQWSDTIYKEVLSSVLEDILMGENLDTDRDPWAAGTLAEQVRNWMEEGKTALDIRYIMGSFVYQKAVQKHKRITKSPGEKRMKGITYKTHQVTGSETSTEIVESRFELSGKNEEKIKWMSKSEPDVETRDLVQKISEDLRSEDPHLFVLWKAYKQYPDSPLSELREEELNFSEKEKEDLPFEVEKEETLQGILDSLDISSVYYVRNKFRDWMKENAPEAVVHG